MTSSVPYLEAATMRAALPPRDAVDAVRAALTGGFDPATDPRRGSIPLARGEFLIMPSEVGGDAGVKVLTVAPGNPGRGQPRIQGLYVLVDAATLAPRLLLDGAELTGIRTPAVSIAAIEDALPHGDEPLDVVLYGAGPQAIGHLATLRAVRGPDRPLGAISFVARTPRPIDEPGAVVLATGSAEAVEATRRAGLVICATTAREPLFDSSVVRDDAIVVAVGSHEPDARELDAALLGRSQVVVEDVAAALRECGDVVLAIDEGALARERLIPMSAVAGGGFTREAGHPLVFKSSGMSWEDLVIAAAIARAIEPRSADAGASTSDAPGAEVRP